MALRVGVKAVKEVDGEGEPWLYSACGHCKFCLAARETVCGQAQFGGDTKTVGLPSTSSPARGRIAAT